MNEKDKWAEMTATPRPAETEGAMNENENESLKARIAALEQENAQLRADVESLTLAVQTAETLAKSHKEESNRNYGWYCEEKEALDKCKGVLEAVGTIIKAIK